VVTALEEGRNHHALKLSFVARLADILAVSVDKLLESSTDPVVDSHGVAELAASVGALLFDTATFTPVEALAEATGHTLDDVGAALDSLESRLAAGRTVSSASFRPSGYPDNRRPRPRISQTSTTQPPGETWPSTNRSPDPAGSVGRQRRRISAVEP
jgi:hypothetical protein